MPKGRGFIGICGCCYYLLCSNIDGSDAELVGVIKVKNLRDLVGRKFLYTFLNYLLLSVGCKYSSLMKNGKYLVKNSPKLFFPAWSAYLQ